ncbi:hypothetical protein CCP3SC15_1460003 [Gammaproteobacteria bacterium]
MQVLDRILWEAERRWFQLSGNVDGQLYLGNLHDDEKPSIRLWAILRITAVHLLSIM